MTVATVEMLAVSCAAKAAAPFTQEMLVAVIAVDGALFLNACNIDVHGRPSPNCWIFIQVHCEYKLRQHLAIPCACHGPDATHAELLDSQRC